nr:MAG TPA: hypothetical protein [Caudoviricetes sp.]
MNVTLEVLYKYTYITLSKNRFSVLIFLPYPLTLKSTRI